MEDKIIFPNSFLSDVVPLSPDIEMEDEWGFPYRVDFDWISTEDPDQCYTKVEFAAPTPPSIPEVETCASNESSISDYYGIAHYFLFYFLWKE